jgi:hypothetical protein
MELYKFNYYNYFTVTTHNPLRYIDNIYMVILFADKTEIGGRKHICPKSQVIKICCEWEKKMWEKLQQS